MRTTVILAALWLSAGAQGADLVQIYRDAIANDAQYAAARAQVEAVRERKPQARAGLLPTINLGAAHNYNMILDSPLGSRNYSTDTYNVQLTQPLYRRQNWVVVDQAELQVTQAEAQLEQARQDLIVRTSQAYFDVLLARDTLEVLGAQKKATAEQFESAKRNFEVGTATITDTHEAQARYDLVVAQEIAATNDLEVKRQVLRRIIGREPDALAPLRAEVRISRPEPDEMQQWVDMAEKDAFTVQAQQAAAEIATLEMRRTRFGHHPTLDLVAAHGTSVPGTGVTTNQVTSNTVGLQFNLPLYAGGAITSREREAAAARERALSDLDDARRSAALSARQAFLGVTSGMAQTRALEQALVSSQSALDSNRLGYEVGVRINIDVLNAQQQVSATRRDLARSKYETLMAQLRLRSAIGGLGEDDVEAVNALLER